VLKNSAIVARNLFYCNQIFNDEGAIFVGWAGPQVRSPNRR
jgi:hypothetical protein